MCRGHDPLIVDEGAATEDGHPAVATWLSRGQSHLPPDLPLVRVDAANDLVNPVLCLVLATCDCNKDVGISFFCTYSQWAAREALRAAQIKNPLANV